MLDNLTLGDAINYTFPVLALIISAQLAVRGGKWAAAFIAQVWKFYSEVIVPNQQARSKEIADSQVKVGEGLARVGGALEHVEVSFAREIAALRDDIRDGFAAMQGQLLDVYRRMAWLSPVSGEEEAKTESNTR